MVVRPVNLVLSVFVLAWTFTSVTSLCSQPISLGSLSNDVSNSIVCSQESSDEVLLSSEEVNSLAQVLSEGNYEEPSGEIRQSEDDTFLRNLRMEGHKFLRFGRSPDHKFMRFGREPNEKLLRIGREPDHKFMRFGRTPDHKFMRFGRQQDHKFMRFGRETDRNFMRNQREPQHNFMRFGRSVNPGDQNDFIHLIKRNNPDSFKRVGRQPDHKFIRFGRQPDHKFMRFGRGNETPAVNANNIISEELLASNSNKNRNIFPETSPDNQ